MRRDRESPGPGARAGLAALAMALALLLAPARPAPAGEGLALGLPVDCAIGRLCHIQFYVDRDPGPGSLDYRCGPESYDGHGGTDFRLPDLVAMAAGVAVIAAADGIVRAIRDGMEDRSLDDIDPASIAGREAGNAVVLVHPGGWETQYSHLRRNSVRVHPGDAVARGDPLGLIGLSGKSNYPHVDFEVRHDGLVVDPFTGTSAPMGCAPGARSLWLPAARAALAYEPGGVLNAGFADALPDRRAVRAGAYRAGRLGVDSKVLVFWTDVFGARPGDEEVFRVYRPDGSLLVEHRATLAEGAHQRFNYAGRARPEGGWPAGVYRGVYQLRRVVGDAPRAVLEAERRVIVE